MTPSRFLTIRAEVRAQAALDYALSERLDPMTAVALELVEELERWAAARAACQREPSPLLVAMADAVRAAETAGPAPLGVASPAMVAARAREAWRRAGCPTWADEAPR